MKPLPGGCYTACNYKAVLKVPNNYHIEYDGHYYSVLYSYCGKPAILKATASEIRICDQYNRLICTHKRSYREFPLYITVDEHMPPEPLYYKEVNAKDGNYYRRWASAIGPAMSELIDRLLKSSKHEEQSYNACAGILHKVKTIFSSISSEAIRKTSFLCSLNASYSTSSSSVPSGRIYPQLSHTPSSASIPSFTKASMPPGS